MHYISRNSCMQSDLMPNVRRRLHEKGIIVLKSPNKNSPLHTQSKAGLFNILPHKVKDSFISKQVYHFFFFFLQRSY